MTGVPSRVPICAVSGVIPPTESGSAAIGRTGLLGHQHSTSKVSPVSCHCWPTLCTHKPHHIHPPQTTLFPHSSQGLHRFYEHISFSRLTFVRTCARCGAVGGTGGFGYVPLCEGVGSTSIELLLPLRRRRRLLLPLLLLLARILAAASPPSPPSETLALSVALQSRLQASFL